MNLKSLISINTKKYWTFDGYQSHKRRRMQDWRESTSEFVARRSEQPLKEVSGFNTLVWKPQVEALSTAWGFYKKELMLGQVNKVIVVDFLPMSGKKCHSIYVGAARKAYNNIISLGRDALETLPEV